MAAPVGPAGSTSQGDHCPEPTALFAFPQKVQLQTIDACNYRCGLCPYPTLSKGRARTRMDVSLLDRIIGDVRGAGRQVQLCLMLQNEPLLDHRFGHLLEQAHSASDAVSSVAAVTNGSMLSDAMLHDLVRFDRFHLTVSVNANDGARYRQVHGVDRWSQLEELLTGWSGPRERVRLSFVVQRDTTDDARAFLDRWSAAGYATRLVPVMSRAGSVTIRPRQQLAVDDFGYCHYPVDTMNVLADGSVILCCNDWVHEQTYGNLFEQSMGEIWNSPAMVGVRDAAMGGRVHGAAAVCRNCDYPMRSSVRLTLEQLCRPAVEPAGGGGEDAFEVVLHRTELRLDGRDEPVSAVVHGIDQRTGTVSVALERSALPAGRRTSGGALLIRIAHGDRFSFGSMTPTWCHCDVQPLADDRGVDGDGAPDDGALGLALLHLDPGDEAYRLLPWYAQDWRRPGG